MYGCPCAIDCVAAKCADCAQPTEASGIAQARAIAAITTTPRTVARDIASELTGRAGRTPGSECLALLPPGPDAVRRLPLRGARPARSVALPAVDARHALLERLIDHAALFPPASMSMPDALAEDRRARASEHAWMLGRFVVPESKLDEVGEGGRELSVVTELGERAGAVLYVEGAPLDEIAARGERAKVRCGGARIPPVEELASFIRGCRERGLGFKATAGLHHAY